MGKVSSFCQDGGCVQVEKIEFTCGPLVFVSHSVSGGAGGEFDRVEWEAFIAGVKAGEFDWDQLVSEPDGE
jgi:hypothetical protein